MPKVVKQKKKGSTTLRMIIMLLCLALLFGGIFGFKLFEMRMMEKYMAMNANPVVTVSAMKASYSPWLPQIKASASLRAIRGVNVTTEVTGMVETINFTPGTNVKQGELLVQLNGDAELARLNALQADADLAKIVYKRDKGQYAARAISKATLDTDAANAKSTQAQVDAQAALLAKKFIRAPFSGKLGISAVNLGQYLNPGDKIVSLQTLDPLYVDFFVPQQTVSQLKVGQLAIVNCDAFPHQTFTGKITTINPAADVNTRNIEIEVTIPNPHYQLLPGMYSTVTIDTGASTPYITLPQSAISFNPYGNIVYLIQETGRDKKNNPILTVTQKFVTTGKTRGDQITILKGLNAGDLVVTSGQLKLKNGSTVAINNSAVPENNPAPTPVDE